MSSPDPRSLRAILGEPPAASLLTDEERAALAAERAEPLTEPLLTFLRELTEAQEGTRIAHTTLAQRWRERAGQKRDEARRRRAEADQVEAEAATLDAIAAAHEALAENVPDAAGAAANLGTATDRHAVNNVATVAEGARILASRVDDDQLMLAAQVVDLRGVVEKFAQELLAHQRHEEAYQRRAERRRDEMAAALAALLRATVNGDPEATP